MNTMNTMNTIDNNLVFLAYYGGFALGGYLTYVFLYWLWNIESKVE